MKKIIPMLFIFILAGCSFSGFSANSGPKMSAKEAINKITELGYT